MSKISKRQTVFAILYQQYDGYFTGVGMNLLRFLQGMVMVNGIPMRNDRPEKIANGEGCLFAQIIVHFKKEVGGAYLVDPSDEDYKEEYNYSVDVCYIDELPEIRVSLARHHDVKFAGTVDECIAYVETLQEED